MPDISDPEYWEKILIKNNLGMNRGLMHQISYVGNSKELSRIQENKFELGQVENGGRRVKPKGCGPDKES